MKVRDARLPAEHSAHVSVVDQPREFLRVRVGRALVGDGDFTRADHFGYIHYVFADRTHDRSRRHVIAPRPDEGRQSFFSEGLCFRQKARHCLHRGVNAECADDSSYPCADNLAQMNLRCLSAKPVLATAAEKMLVWVNESGSYNAVGRVYYFQIEVKRFECSAVYITNSYDAVIDDQDIGSARRLRCIDLPIFNQYHH